MLAQRVRSGIRLLVYEYVTGGGLAGQEIPRSLAQEGRAMRDAVVRDFGSVRGVAVNTTSDPRAAGGAQDRCTVETIGPGEERETLERLLRMADAALVIAPETDGILEERERWVRASGVCSLGCAPEVVALARDKPRCNAWLAERGVGVLETHVLGCPPHRAVSFEAPFVIKPRDGAGSVDTFLVRDGSAWPRLPRADLEFVAQPYREWPPMSAACLISRDGLVEWIGSAHQHVRRQGDRLVYRGGAVPGVFPDALRDRLERALRSLRGACGWLGIDFLVDDETGNACVLEMNPRLTTSYVGYRKAFGRDGGRLLAERWLAKAGLVDDQVGEVAPLQVLESVSFSATGRVLARKALR